MKFKKTSFLIIIGLLIIVGGYCFLAKSEKSQPVTAQNFQFDEQTATILAIKKVMPSVVSIRIYSEQSVLQYDLATGQAKVIKEKIQSGSGTGILISADGLILTNKHVVSSVNKDLAQYRIILASGKEYYAQLIGVDPIYDLAVLKIFDRNLPFVELGDSDRLEIGASVIAIGNSLGRYQNSATKGIISGLGRSFIASDQNGNSELMDNVIQTDAEINPGNSGGPLIDLRGRVIGINTAIDTSGASIGFAIPINDVRPIIKSVRESGQIIRPKLGVSYQMITPEIARDHKLSRDNGAWITSDDKNNPAVLPGSAAEKAGLKDGDIIYEVNGIKLEGNRSLLSVVQRYKPGDKIGLKIQRGEKIMTLVAILDKF